MNVHQPQFQPPQQPALDIVLGEKFVQTLFTDARHKALFGGRGSAKSWSVATYLIVKACKERKRIVCCRQFQNSIRDSSKELVEKRIRGLGLDAQFDMTERAIIHKGTQAEFMFMGLERNVESIRSLEGADIVWVEEARTIKAKSMEILLPTVRTQGSELLWTWNPELPDDPVDAYFRKGAPPPRSIVTFVDYTDNPFFLATELPVEMETMKQGNYQRYKHVWLGEYDTRHESKVFPNVTIGEMAIDPDTMAPRFGCDFGFGNDPSFVTKVYVDDSPRKRIYIAAEAHGRVSMDDLPYLVRGILGESGDYNAQVRCDSSQPGTIEFLKRRGLNVVGATKGPGSIKAGIQFLQGYQLIIDPACEALREEARLYSWMTDRLTGQVLSTPVDANNHGWDSVRYAVEDLSLEGNNAAYDPSGGVIRLKLW